MDLEWLLIFFWGVYHENLTFSTFSYIVFLSVLTVFSAYEDCVCGRAVINLCARRR